MKNKFTEEEVKVLTEKEMENNGGKKLEAEKIIKERHEINVTTEK